MNASRVPHSKELGDVLETPLPLLGAFASIESSVLGPLHSRRPRVRSWTAAFTQAESSFLDRCIHAGRQVLDVKMEQDREDLCGAGWKRDADRNVGRSGTALG